MAIPWAIIPPKPGPEDCVGAAAGAAAAGVGGGVPLGGAVLVGAGGEAGCDLVGPAMVEADLLELGAPRGIVLFNFFYCQLQFLLDF